MVKIACSSCSSADCRCANCRCTIGCATIPGAPSNVPHAADATDAPDPIIDASETMPDVAVIHDASIDAAPAFVPETLTVPSTGQVVMSDVPLTAGTSYTLTISGVASLSQYTVEPQVGQK